MTRRATTSFYILFTGAGTLAVSVFMPLTACLVESGCKQPPTNEIKEHTMNVKTKLKAGRIALNHNETATSGLRIRTGVTSGGISLQHNETAVGRASGERCR
jgi:hypothetical protein